MLLKKLEARIQIRALIFILLLTLTIGLALSAHLSSDEMRFGGWLMFSGHASDICAVEYQSIDPAGNTQVINRFLQLGYSSPKTAPNNIRIIRSIPQALAVGKKLCQAKNSSIITELSCPIRGEWKKLISHVEKC